MFYIIVFNKMFLNNTTELFFTSCAPAVGRPKGQGSSPGGSGKLSPDN